MTYRFLKNLIVLLLINFCTNYGFTHPPMQVAGTATIQPLLRGTGMQHLLGEVLHLLVMTVYLFPMVLQ